MAGEWREMPFSEAVLVNPGVQLARGKNYPFVDMGAVNTTSRCVFASEVRIYKGGGSRFSGGDTLMARITPCLENGKIARFCGKHGELAHGSTEFIVIRGRDGVTETSYAYYLTRWDGVTGCAIGQMTGTSGRQRVPTSALDHLLVPIPPLTEQRAIAHILGTLDDKIELNRRMNETLEAMARAIFKSWFVDFDPVRAKAEGRQPFGMDAETAALFPDSFEDSPLGSIPKGWKVCVVGDVVEVGGGSTPSTKEPAYWDGQLHWATPKDLSVLHSPVLLDTERRITQAGLEQIGSRLYPSGTVLLSSRAPIGYLAITEISLAVNQGMIAMACGTNPSNHYMLQWTRSNMEVIESRASGTTFQEISKSSFRSIPLLLPSDAVAGVFTEKVQFFHRQIVNNVRESGTLAAIRDSLLPKLIAGELRVETIGELREAR